MACAATPGTPKPARQRAGFGVLVPLLVMSGLTLPLVGVAQVNNTGQYLARMDVDGDGRVSLPEYQDWLSYAFDAMDRNRDGVLVAAELPGGRGPRITRTQHRTRLAAAFARQDHDRNGWLDASELGVPPSRAR